MSEKHPHPIHREGDPPALWRCPVCGNEIVLLGPYEHVECILCGCTGTDRPDHRTSPEPGAIGTLRGKSR